MTKKYDVVATTGTYINSQGEEKKRYQNVGAIIDKGNGPFLVLEKWFNPAGLESPILSLFEPKMKKDGYKEAKQAASNNDDFVQDIPF